MYIYVPTYIYAYIHIFEYIYICIHRDIEIKLTKPP